MEKKVTIKDVAKHAGVTAAVVSRVFNNDETLNIKEETRAAVFEAIKTLDYRPNSIARSLRTSTSNAVGVLVPDIMNPFFTEIIKGIQIASKLSDFSIVLCDTSDNPEDEKRYIDVLRSQLVDGIILGSSYVEDDVIDTLTHSDMKYVMLNRASSNSPAPYVKTNDTKGLMLAVQHLVELGHKKIAHLTGPLYADTALRRLEGYRKALKQYGIEYNSKYIVETKFDEESGYEACKELLKLDERPTAICAANDLVAIGAMRAISEAGLRVPDDISIVGYNDIWVASRLAPPLTTIHTPLLEMGQLSFQMLMDCINEKDDVQEKIVLEPFLVIRESTMKLQ